MPHCKKSLITPYRLPAQRMADSGAKLYRDRACARLTEKQRACMQLVVMRKSSKEIARELGIAKPTVDQRIASARQILGARNRDEAANMFARYGDIYDRVPYDRHVFPQNNHCPICRSKRPDRILVYVSRNLPFLLMARLSTKPMSGQVFYEANPARSVRSTVC